MRNDTRPQLKFTGGASLQDRTGGSNLRGSNLRGRNGRALAPAIPHCRRIKTLTTIGKFNATKGEGHERKFQIQRAPAGKEIDGPSSRTPMAEVHHASRRPMS